MEHQSNIDLYKIKLPETMDLRSNKDLFGFVDWGDFWTSFLGLKFAMINLSVSAIAVISTFIVDIIWESAEAIYLLYFMMLVDWATGLTYAFKSKTYWSRKNWRMPIYFIFTTMLLSLAFNLSKHSIIFLPMPAIVYGGFCSVYLTSILENLAKLEWLPPAIVTLIKNKFGFKVLFDKAGFDEKKKDQKAAKKN